jgi:UrcA family protein
MYVKLNSRLTVALIAALGSSVSAFAAPNADAVAVKVSSVGLDLSSNAGARAMFRRLSVASEQACGVEAEFDALHAGAFRVCYRHALSNAVRALNQPAVTHVYVALYPRDAARYGVADVGYVAVR